MMSEEETTGDGKTYPEMSGQKSVAVCESPNIPVYLPIPMYGLVVYQGRQIFPRIWNLKMLVHYICYDF